MPIRTPSLAAAIVLTLAPASAAVAASATGENPAGLFLEALDAADLGLYDQALEVLEDVALQVPDDAYVELERAEMMLHLGRVEEASRTVARARELAPSSDDALRLQGRIELLRADRDGTAAATARDAFERLREHDPEDLEALVALGQIYLAADQPGLAADALAEASRLRPGHPGIESLLGRALESGADPGRVEQVQRERLARNPTALDTRLELVDLLGRQGRAEEALEVLEGASQAQAGSFDVRRRLALYLYLTGELDRALEAARGMVEEWPEYGGGRLLLARIETTFGRFQEAERTLAPLLTRPPLPEAVADVHVRILEGSGRIEEAAAQLDEDRQRLLGEGRRAEADGLALGQARLWARHGRVEEALGPARTAAASEIASDREDGTLLLARLLAELGRYDEALETLGPADPRRPRFAALRVGVMIDAGREEAASAEVELLLAEAPETDLRLGEMYAERERFDAAIPLLERAVAREPGSLEGAFRLAAAYERGGRIEDSVARFEEVLEAAPDFAPALNYLGYLWIDRGENLERALRLVRRAVRLDPDNGAYVDSLGWGLYRLGRHEEAVETLEWAARLEPDDATVLEHLGDALAATGRIDGAADAYRRALESSGGGSPSEAARKLERLRTER